MMALIKAGVVRTPDTSPTVRSRFELVRTNA
jgi:hypothetical protein